MKHLTRAFLAIGLMAVLITSVAPLKASAAFSANDVMDDSIFNNSRTMSVADIQNFLNQFPNSCLRNLQAPYPDTYFNYGGPVSAATVIRRASDLWDINPQVILATLEKESSVVTGNASYGCQYLNTSMGFNCPDAGSCPQNPADAGFSQQVTKGSWLLKMAEERANGRVNYDSPLDPDDDRNYYYSGPMTEGYRQRRYDAPLQYFDGLLTIDGQTIHVDTGATAAMYFYTPHFHGNQLFVSIFERWFGPTKGTVLLRGSGDTVFVQSSDPSVAYGVPSGEILKSYGLQSTAITPVSDTYLASLNTSNQLTTLFYQPNDGTIFLADGGYKIGIASGSYCTAWALPCDQANKVMRMPYVVSSNMPARTPLSNVMLYNSVLYAMVNGTKRPFLNPSDKSLSPYNNDLTTPIIQSINSTQTVGAPMIYSRMFFRTANGAIFYHSDGQFFNFNSFDNFKVWWDGSNVNYDPFSSFNTTPPSSVLLLNFTTDGTNKYMMAGTKRYTLPAGNTVGTTNTSSYSQLNSLLSGKQTITIDDSRAFALANGTIGTIRSQQFRPIPTLADLFLSFSSSNIAPPQPFILEAFPAGMLYIVPGRVVKPPDSNAMYVMGSDGYLWGLGSLTELNATQVWFNNVLTTPFSAVENSGIKVFTATLKMNGVYYAVQGDGSIRILPSAILSAQKDDYAMPVSGVITSKFPWDSRSFSFIRFDNGTIFKVEGNVIRPISNMATYSALGGTADNTTQVSVKAAQMFNTGSPL